MEKKRLQATMKTLNGILFCVLTAAFSLMGNVATAQTITISPKTGNVIAAASYEGELHRAGFGGAWIHNQLPMNWFTSDSEDLSEDGLMKKHANNVCPNGNGFILVSGTGSNKNHMSLSLPKGYRFTGYSMVLSYHSKSDGALPCTMREMDGNFSTTYASVGVTTTSKQVRLSRTASRTSTNPMGNVLYFLQDKDNGRSFVEIESFEVSFECDDAFDLTMRPTAASTTGVDCTTFAFGTQRTDLGAITWTNGNNGSNYAWRYDYTKVKDLDAYLTLYDEGGIKDGSASTSAVKNRNIKATNVNGGLHYALQNDAYYLEVPTVATTQNGNNIPVGYRITGARLHYYARVSRPAIALGTQFYITNGSGQFMGADLKFSATPTVWQSDTQGYVWTTSNGSTVYLAQEADNWPGTSRTLKTSTSKTTKFGLDGSNLYYQGTISKFYVTKSGTLEANSRSKATLTSAEPSVGNFSIDLYGTDGERVEQTATASESSPSGTLEVTGLNNDAIKFAVRNLDGEAAFVYVELTLEALNPYISKADVVARTLGGDETLAQSYLSDDFTIGDDGQVSLNVPDNFASSGVQVVFDELTSKNADATYGPFSSDGQSRYHFVRSAYYDKIGENLQAHRPEAAESDYTMKVLVEVAGSKQFKVNNSDEFKVGTAQSDKTNAYKEYRYSNAEYESQGGKWNRVELTRDNKTAECYLVTCDETRYNLAPTTTPRHAFYAYYSTNVTLNVADYEPDISYVKVYDGAMLQSGYDQKPYYGAKIGAKMKEGGAAVASGTGYLFAKQILDQINADAGTEGCPADAKHVLYLDASELNSVISSSQNEATYGKVELLQDAIGANAMIYLPAGLTYTLKNVASKTVGGDFRAQNDIVLTDKQPFFAPYDIRVDASNTTEYIRQVTADHGHETYITMALPFTMDIDNSATHTNFDGSSSFQFYQMQLQSAISTQPLEGSQFDYGITGHFSPVGGSTTESNKPYLVLIKSHEGNDGDGVVFVARQRGASIYATPTDAEGLGCQIDGETAQGKIGTESVAFTQHTAFNGALLDGDVRPIFYFWQDMFVSSNKFEEGDRAIYNLPFRTWYDYEGTVRNLSMAISLEPNSDPTGIDDLRSDSRAASVSACGGNGTLTLTAHEDTRINIVNMNGQRMATVNLPSGQTQTVALPAGIYTVNGLKVLVN